MTYIALFFAPAVLLGPLFPLAIQYQNGWRWVYPLALITLAIDVLANYTCLAIITADFPQRDRQEFTFSKRLSRLRWDTGWRGMLCRPIVTYLNWVQPNHIL